LFYRLNVVPIRLPPLRERAGDIALLAQHFLGRAQAEGLPIKTLTPEAMTRLANYRWPGNVRELENLMRRLSALVPQSMIGEEIIEAELADRGVQEVAGPQGEATLDTPHAVERAIERHVARLLGEARDAGEDGVLYDRVLAAFEEPLIRLVLGETRGNQIRAAAMLGLNRNTLRKKIREHDIGVTRRVG
jgi:two-component system nitrogen regulation response regulator GlnG